MRITDLLKKESIELNSAVSSKSEAIEKLIGLQINGGCISDGEKYKKDILAREASASTAVGDGNSYSARKERRGKRTKPCCNNRPWRS